MTTFNDLIRKAGLNPKEVILVRHSGTGATGLKPYDLWLERSDRFDRYQSTQEAGRPIFRKAKYWASFVSGPENTTIFVSLYGASLGDASDVDWDCPLSGLKPGQDKNKPYDFYLLDKREELSRLIAKLQIRWSESERSWVQYAHKNEKIVELGAMGVSLDVPEPTSEEGRRVWRTQLAIERSGTIGKRAKLKNAELNGGHLCCDACQFKHPDPSMFDAHHISPLMAA